MRIKGSQVDAGGKKDGGGELTEKERRDARENPMRCSQVVGRGQRWNLACYGRVLSVVGEVALDLTGVES